MHIFELSDTLVFNECNLMRLIKDTIISPTQREDRNQERYRWAETREQTVSISLLGHLSAQPRQAPLGFRKKHWIHHDIHTAQ